MPTTVAELDQYRWVVYPPSLRSVTVTTEEKAVEVPVQGDVVTDSAGSRLEIFLVHGRRIGPSACLLRDFLLDDARDGAA
ncbi:hypothetical protein [Pseudoxanthomonas sp.]|uniref:hypothetical protein n=1 Tax=Pseudoxanthomonas sp. TaxID=1871049 RepID=UPI002FE3D88B